MLKVLKPQRGGINIARGNAPGTKIVFYAIGKCYIQKQGIAFVKSKNVYPPDFNKGNIWEYAEEVA
ncbi:MAG: hypothetical protein DRR19_12840 [Candidatus Parabeggiatoa sp. nov. 1]|nr:MAG: hypothetical protein DRR19_12840 [Gammaproteobacteria bacterium]